MTYLLLAILAFITNLMIYITWVINIVHSTKTTNCISSDKKGRLTYLQQTTIMSLLINMANHFNS